MVDIQDLARCHFQTALLEHGKRKQMVHQAVRGGHYDTALILKQMFEHLHTLSRQQVSMNIRTIKQ